MSTTVGVRPDVNVGQAVGRAALAGAVWTVLGTGGKFNREGLAPALLMGTAAFAGVLTAGLLADKDLGTRELATGAVGVGTAGALALLGRHPSFPGVNFAPAALIGAVVAVGTPFVWQDYRYVFAKQD